MAAVAAQTSRFHGWLWRLRLTEAREDRVCGDSGDALRWADEAIEQSHARGRVKYEILGLTTRAQALIKVDRMKEAVADLVAAVAPARPAGDPALLLRACGDLLAVEGNDTLADEARAARQRIREAVPEADMLRRFELAIPVSLLSERV